MKKHNWFKLSQDTGDTAMSQGELEEAHGGNIPSGATLGGFRWTTHYMELTLPTTIDPNKILISALKNKKTPEEIAAVAYTEAFYATQKAQDLAKKLNTTNPQEIQKYLYESILSGNAYNPADPYAKEHEERHRQGERMNIDKVKQELAAGLPGDIDAQEKIIIVDYFVNSWINNVMRLYGQDEWESEFYAMFPQMKDMLNNHYLEMIRKKILEQMPKENI